MRVGRLYGVEIHLNNAFLALLGLFFVAGVLGKGLIVFAVVLLHELAHVVAARRLGVRVSDVELLPFGGVSRIGSEVVTNPSKEVVVAAAGPATNLLLAGLAIALKNYGFWDDVLGPFFLQCNLMIAAFNLLPALPLDGGRIFRACLARRLGFREATHRAARWGQVWGALITLGGVAGLAAGVSGLDVLIIGVFLLFTATREKKAGPFHFIRHLAQKKEELNSAGILPGKTLVSLDSVRLGDVIRTFTPQRFHLVYLLDCDWQYRGVVSETQIIDALFTEGADIALGSVNKMV